MSESAEDKDYEQQANQQELLLKKIHTILEKTDPENWKKGGKPISPTERFEKPRPTWEEAYTLEIPTGVLVMRASTPVKSDFAGRGFRLSPAAPTIFTTEIRAKGWHHSEITDPYRRSRHSDRSCTVLAEGGIAEKLYNLVHHTYLSHFGEKQDKFEKDALHLVSTLPGRFKEETLSDWERSEEVPGEIHYSAYIEEMEITVIKAYKEDRESYSCQIIKDSLETEITEYSLVKELYTAIEELGQTSRLATLTKALEQL